MAAKFIPLDEAARILNVAADRLVDMIKEGQIRGFRDGASWKFPEQEVARIQDEGFDVLDEMPLEGSSVLISDRDMDSGYRSGSSVIIGGDKAEGKGSGSDIELGAEADPDGSGLMLVPAESASDVRLVPSGRTPGPAPSDDGSLEDLLKMGDDELNVKRSSSPVNLNRKSDDSIDGLLQVGEDTPSLDESASAINLGKLSAEEVLGKSGINMAKVQSSDGLELFDDGDLASEMPTSAPGHSGSRGSVLSDLDVLSSEHGGSGLIRGDSSGSVLSGSNISSLLGGESTPINDGIGDGSDLAIADDDDLVLGGSGSDLAIAGDSGLNLMSPSDSGLSLEAEPLDLAGSSISALDLAVDAQGSSKSGSGAGSSGSLVDFRADEEFNLSPSGVGLETDDDSGSQVIEVEDSAEAFGGGMGEGVLDAAGFDDFGEVPAGQLGADADMDVTEDIGVTETAERPQGVAMVPAYEVPFSVFNVLALLSVVMVMSLGGMIMTDMVRNMADFAGANSQVNSLTDAVLGMFGLKK